MLENQALAVVNREAVGPVTDPVAVLQSLASEAVQLKDYFAGRVAVLEELRYQGHAGEQIRGELLMYERALDRSAKFCEALARLGLDERAVQLTEQQGQLMATAVRAALEVCGLADRTDLLSAIADELRHRAALESLPSGGSR